MLAHAGVFFFFSTENVRERKISPRVPDALDTFGCVLLHGVVMCFQAMKQSFVDQSCILAKQLGPCVVCRFLCKQVRTLSK